MTEPVKAKLFVIDEFTDQPIDEITKDKTGIEVQFNPATLKVSLSNSIGQNDKGGTAQYIDKRSSSLTVELIFDTSDRLKEEEKEGKKSQKRIDVRNSTGAIAKAFMTPTKPKKGKKPVPQRCLFQWGTFGFIGIMESFDETLDFFSAEGTPLRATVALKLSESHFQFMSKEAAETQQNTPELSSIGEKSSVNEANKDTGKPEQDWRDTSMYNGIESPRLPSAGALAVPSVSASASVGAAASVSAGASFSAGAPVGASAKLTPPSFKYGASASLGTGIPGAFSVSTTSAPAPGLRAGAIATGGASLRTSGRSVKAQGQASGKAGVGFD